MSAVIPSMTRPGTLTSSAATSDLVTAEGTEPNNDVPPTCSWAEVMASMEAASQEYKSKAENDKLRTMQRNRAVAATLQSLADMIPEQDGLSILRGGLNGIFKLLKKRIDNGERILAAFEDIPITFSEACHALVAHPHDGPLRESVLSLYNVVKEQIDILTAILLRKHKASLPRRLFKQHPENEAAAIEHCLELINRASRRVSVRVSNLANETMLATLQEARNVSQEMYKTQSAITNLQNGLVSIQDTQLELERNSTARYERQEVLTQAFFNTISENVQRSFIDCETQLNMGFGDMQESLHRLMWYTPPTMSLPSGNQARRSPSPYGYDDQEIWRPTMPISLSYDELYMIINPPNPLYLVSDLGMVLRASYSMSHEGLSRGAWLLNMDRFKTWAQIPNSSSDLILVDGHLAEFCRGKLSPLSVISATFASMNKVPCLTVLTHFCGLHSVPGDPMSGCRGMILSLVAQLVVMQRNYHKGTRICLEDNLLQAIAHHDLEALCGLFQALLSQSSPDLTVYCIIDNVCQFETALEGWGDELCYVVGMLQALTSKRRLGPVLKVLLTTSNRSIKTFRQIEVGSRVSLAAGHQSSRSIKRTSIETGWFNALG